MNHVGGKNIKWAKLIEKVNVFFFLKDFLAFVLRVPRTRTNSPQQEGLSIDQAHEVMDERSHGFRGH